MKKTVFALFLALFLAGCSGGEHEGHHHEDNLQVTAYNETYEVYAEVTPMCVGHHIEVLAHVTKLADFKPLEEGSLTVSIIVGGEGVRETQKQQQKPGVYSFVLEAPAAGEAKMVFDITTKEGSSRLVVDNLRVYEDEEEAEHAAIKAIATSSNGVAFPKEKSWRVDFATAPVAKRPMGQLIKTVGQIQPSQGDVRTIVARSAGEVTFVKPDLTDGTGVSAGQALFSINGSRTADDNLQVRYATARNEYQVAQAEYDRLKALAADRLVTQTELTAAKTAADNARALYQSLQAGFSGGVSSVSSPISGFITSLQVTNGQYVEAGQPLATVAQNRDLFVKADIQPSYFPYLSDVNDVIITCNGQKERWNLAELHGTVVSYGRSVDSDNPLIPMVLRIDNSAGLVPGTFVNLSINAGEQTPVTAVPSDALVEEMGNYFVYVQLTPEYFEKREVKVGRNDGQYAEITEGVKEGERVVSRGAVLVKLSQASGALDPHAGHVH